MMNMESTNSATPLRAWQSRLQISDRKAAELLGISYGTYTGLIGSRSKGAPPKPLDTRTAYACAALEAGLQPHCPDWADRRTVLAMAALDAGIKSI